MIMNILCRDSKKSRQKWQKNTAPFCENCKWDEQRFTKFRYRKLL